MSPRKSAAIFQPSESQLHRTVAELLDWALPDDAVYTTFPAGWGDLPPATAGRLKGCGLKRGFPDILIFHDMRTVGIELKVKGRKPSPAQQLMFPRLRRAGVQIFVCESIDDVVAALFKANIPLRGRFWENYSETASDTNAEARSAQELT